MKRLFIGDKERCQSGKSIEQLIAEKISVKPLEIERSCVYRGYFIYYKEGKMGNLDWYYKLDRDGRWLDNPCQIGGMDTDIGTISSSLEMRIRELFPINQVPENVVGELAKVKLACEKAESAIENFIGFFSKLEFEKQLKGK